MKRGINFSGRYRYMVSVDSDYWFGDDEMVANRFAIDKKGKLWILSKLGTTTYRLIHNYSPTTVAA